MNRVVKFGEGHHEFFNVLYEGLLLGAVVREQEKKRTLEVRRQERRLHKALKSVSEEIQQQTQNGERMRKLTVYDTELLLDQKDLALLIAYVESVPWMVQRNELALDACDWLDASEKRE